MEFRDALKQLVAGGHLTFDQMHGLMSQLMAGHWSDAQIGGFLAALAAKGETSTEISAAAQAMRDIMLAVPMDAERAVDIVGTGGDGANLFNVSTAASFVVAAAGVPVAKHGNRSVSSSSGSADLLESAGLKLALDSAQVARCIDEVGIGFMFAPNHHLAMRHAGPARRELGIKTLFNILGPLTNPAGARHQVIGVYAPRLLPIIADAMRQLGSLHTLVVHGEEGLDELSIAGPSLVCDMSHGELSEYQVTPEQLGLKRHSLDALKVSHCVQSLELVMQALRNEPGAARDMVALNAGAALYAADQAESLAAGVQLALATLAQGTPLDVLKALAHFTQGLASEC